jgi:Zn-finger nucleic acid-binding protein
VVASGSRAAGYLVACPRCHAQYDATGVGGASFLCHCGTRVANTRPAVVEAAVRRCGACGAGVATGAERCTYCGSPLGGGAGCLVCPECFARNRDDARFCASCGVAFRPEPVVADGDPVQCPVCRTPLTPRSLAGLGVQECGTCDGLWLPAVNFDALVDRVRARRQPEASEGLHRPDPSPLRGTAAVAYRACPVCGAYMNRKNFARISGVVVDWCRTDGTWLDADELQRIAAFVGDGGLERSADREREDARIAASLRVLERAAPPANAAPPRTLLDVLVDLVG